MALSPRWLLAAWALRPLRDHLHLDAPLVAAIDLHLGRLADDHKIGADAFVLDKGVGGDAVAPLLHVAEVVGRPAFQQAQFVRHGQPVDHAAGC